MPEKNSERFSQEAKKKLRTHIKANAKKAEPLQTRGQVQQQIAGTSWKIMNEIAAEETRRKKDEKDRELLDVVSNALAKGLRDPLITAELGVARLYLRQQLGQLEEPQFLQEYNAYFNDLSPAVVSYLEESIGQERHPVTRNGRVIDYRNASISRAMKIMRDVKGGIYTPRLPSE